jgi:hypothetical protein
VAAAGLKDRRISVGYLASSDIGPDNQPVSIFDISRQGFAHSLRSLINA